MEHKQHVICSLAVEITCAMSGISSNRTGGVRTRPLGPSPTLLPTLSPTPSLTFTSDQYHRHYHHRRHHHQPAAAVKERDDDKIEEEDK